MASLTPAESAARSGPGFPTASVWGAGVACSSVMVRATEGAGSLGGVRVLMERHRKERDGRQQDRKEERLPDPTPPFAQLPDPRHAARKRPVPFEQTLPPFLPGTYSTGG